MYIRVQEDYVNSSIEILICFENWQIFKIGSTKAEFRKNSRIDIFISKLFFWEEVVEKGINCCKNCFLNITEHKGCFFTPGQVSNGVQIGFEHKVTEAWVWDAVARLGDALDVLVEQCLTCLRLWIALIELWLWVRFQARYPLYYLHR